MYKIVIENTGIKWRLLVKEQHTNRFDNFLENRINLSESEARERARKLALALNVSCFYVLDSTGEDEILL